MTIGAVFVMGSLLLVPEAFGQSGAISGGASQCTIPAGLTNCTSDISWTSTGTTAVQVWVQLNGGTPSLFAQTGSNGSSNATWIGPLPSNSYIFYLYDYSSGSLGSQLASVLITGQYGISLTYGNSARPNISPSFVVGDAWALSVTGAGPYASIAIAWTNVATGAHLGPYTAGLTNSSGSYSGTPVTVVSGNIGRWTGQWTVGGEFAGSPISMQVIPLPHELSVGTPATAFNCSYPNNTPYGVVARVNWLVEDSGGVNIHDYEVPLVPLQIIFGSTYTNPSPDVNYGDITGFDDGPFGVGYCSTGPISSFTYGESIRFAIGGFAGATDVRSNTWTVTSTSPNHGTITNSIDVAESN